MNSDSSHQKPLEGDNECENPRKSKARVEEWFSTHENKENVTEDNKSTKSSHSSKTHRSRSSHSSTSHYSRTSSLLSAKIKEQQRKAELPHTGICSMKPHNRFYMMEPLTYFRAMEPLTCLCRMELRS